jgi:hypothetical protein
LPSPLESLFGDPSFQGQRIDPGPSGEDADVMSANLAMSDHGVTVLPCGDQSISWGLTI